MTTCQALTTTCQALTTTCQALTTTCQALTTTCQALTTTCQALTTTCQALTTTCQALTTTCQDGRTCGIFVPSCKAYIFLKSFSVRLLLVLRGHSGFSSPPQRSMTSDFEGFSIRDFIHYIYFPILILEKESVFSLLNVQC